MSPQIVLGSLFDSSAFSLDNRWYSCKNLETVSKESSLTDNINNFKKKSNDISLEIQKHYMPDYLEKVAMERFDMAGENDLVFVFSQESSIKKQNEAK